MSFLQPWMLIALPLAMIPIIIHLINQRRYQTRQWAAMMFLLSANRMNRGYARIRQWLILALRALAIAALVIAIGRPLASGSLGGGWIGSVAGGGAQNTIVLVDRSPSMQQRDGGATLTKLQIGIAQLSETLRTIGVGRLVLIESNRAEPVELESPEALLESPQAGPSDASADLPAMMLAALDYIKANELGQAEVWICSDLREHDWRAKDGRWSSLREAFMEIGQRVRFRLLAYPQVAQANRAVRVDEVRLDDRGAESMVSISLKIESEAEANASAGSASETIPVTIELEGARSTVDVPFDGVIGEVKGHRIAVPKGTRRGWGRVSVPADTGPADDDFYFTFDVAPPRRTVIVTADAEVGRVLRLAAEIASEEDVQSVAEIVPPEAVGAIPWDGVSLVLWQAPFPSGDAGGDLSTFLESFVDRGGQVIFFPHDSLDGGGSSALPFGMKWGLWNSPRDEAAIASWRGDADLLAATLAGAALPVGSLKIRRFVSLEGEATALATIDGGRPLLARVASPRGGVYVCTTTPRAGDSSLAVDGVVLYVMIQRAIAAGAKALQGAGQLDAGQFDSQRAAAWQPLAERPGRLSTDRAFSAGVYADDDRWLAVNRSVGEDHRAVLASQQVDQLFQGLAFARVNDEASQTTSLVEEIWRAFVVVMLAAMIGEACLCLPRKLAETASPLRGGITA